MKEIIILELPYEYGDVVDVIHPVILRDKKSTILIDCGHTGSFLDLQKALNDNNVKPESVTHIIITHHDHDHVGALRQFKDKYEDVIIMASRHEAPFISGSEKTERLIQAEVAFSLMSDEDKVWAQAFIDLLKSVKTVPVDVTVDPQETLDLFGGIKVLDTKGHTGGHISLYIEHMETVIVGDAAIVQDRKLQLANPQFTLNMEDAEASLTLIKELPVKTYICYHGGLLSRGA